MANDDCDYDDLISQNILIRREEKEDKTGVVEVLKKQSDDYENLYQKQADIYRMDVDLLKDEDVVSEEDSSEYEVVTKPAKRELSPDYNEGESSSDSDWEVQRKPKTHKGSFQCDECDKVCATKHGLSMHKRSHQRQKAKMQKEDITRPPTPPVTNELSNEVKSEEVKQAESANELSETEKDEKVEETKENTNGESREVVDEKETEKEENEVSEDDVSPSPENNIETPLDEDDDDEDEEDDEDD